MIFLNEQAMVRKRRGSNYFCWLLAWCQDKIARCQSGYVLFCWCRANTVKALQC